jgi:hypothetical protein
MVFDRAKALFKPNDARKRLRHFIVPVLLQVLWELWELKKSEHLDGRKMFFTVCHWNGVFLTLILLKLDNRSQVTVNICSVCVVFFIFIFICVCWLHAHFCQCQLCLGSTGSWKLIWKLMWAKTTWNGM